MLYIAHEGGAFMTKLITLIASGILSLLIVATVTLTIITTVSNKELCTVSYYVGEELLFDSKVEKGKEVTKPKDPIIEGKNFDAWYNEKEFTTPYDFSTKIISDKSLYAKFNAKTFKVTFESNGGSAVPEISVEYNNKAELPTPTKEGYQFEGWYKEETFVTKFTSDNLVDTNLTLYAKWKLNVVVQYCIVKFETNGGSTIEDLEVVKDSTIRVPLTVKANSILEGWYKDSEFTEMFNSNTIVDQNMTLYAKWKESTQTEFFTVRFDSDNGSAIIEELVEKDHYAVRPNNPTKEGYTFVNWVDSNGVTFNFNTRIIADVDLKAHYDSISDDNFVVSFEANGGTSVSAIIVKKDSTIYPPLSVKEGFVLEGWYTNKDLTNPFDSSTKITSNMTLYAKWKSIDGFNTYKVEFDPDNGSDRFEATVEKGKKVIKPESPVKDGYIFVNWVRESGDIFNFNTIIDQDYRLKANYKEATDVTKYIVKFDTQGGSAIESAIVEAGGKLELPVDPYMEGYKFIGWYTNVDYTTAFNSETPITSDMTLYARWEKYEGAKFTVYFIDYNNNILSVEVSDDVFVYYQEVAYGEAAKAPMKPERDGYRFDRWDKDFSNVTKDLEVRPIYVRAYHVDFYDYNRTLLKSEIVDYGMSATPPEEPSRVGYRFYGWDRDYDIIISDTVVRAVYEQQYHVVFKNYDGSVLSDKWYNYGEEIIAPEIPTYEATEDIMFDKWDKEFNFATENMIITAVVRVKSYTVTFKDYDGSVIKSMNVKEGKDAEAPTINENVYIDWNAEIKKAYSFDKWDKEFTNITADLTVNAVYKEIDGPVLYMETEEVESGTQEVAIKIYVITTAEFGALDFSFVYSDSLNTTYSDFTAKNQFANSANYILSLDTKDHICRFVWYSSRPISLSGGYSEVMTVKFTMDKHLVPGYYACVFLDNIKLTKDGTEYITPVVLSGGVVIK